MSEQAKAESSTRQMGGLDDLLETVARDLANGRVGTLQSYSAQHPDLASPVIAAVLKVAREMPVDQAAALGAVLGSAATPGDEAGADVPSGEGDATPPHDPVEEADHPALQEAPELESLRPPADETVRPAHVFGAFERIGAPIARLPGLTFHVAEHVDDPRHRAVLIFAELDEATPIARWRREARVLDRLGSSGLCAVVEDGLQDDPPWIATRFVPGRSLRMLLDTREETDHVHLALGDETAALTPHRQVVELARWFGGLARGLGQAHAEGLVHGALCAELIMVSPTGPGTILGLGLPRDRLLRPDDTEPEFGDSLSWHRAPEQQLAAADEGRLTPEVDVYALTSMLYEALCGEPPSAQEDDAEESLRRSRDPLPADRLNPIVDEDLAAILARGLSRDPNDRYPDASSLGEDLTRWCRRWPVHARSHAGQRAHARRRVIRRLAVGCCAGLALLAVALGWATATAPDAGGGSRIDAELLQTLAARRSAAPQAFWSEAVPALRAHEDLLNRQIARVARETGRSDRVASAIPLKTLSRGHAARLRDRRLADPFARDAATIAATADPTPDLAANAPGTPGALLRLLQAERDEVRNTLRHITALEEQTLGTLEARRAWGRCLRELRVNERYHAPGVVTQATVLPGPQFGLLPLGRDQASGLWEFWVAGTGPRPVWKGETAGIGGIDLEASPADLGLILVLIPAEHGGEGTAPDQAWFCAKYELSRGQWERMTGKPRGGTIPDLEDSATGPKAPLNRVAPREVHELLQRWGMELPTRSAWERIAAGPEEHDAWRLALATDGPLPGNLAGSEALRTDVTAAARLGTALAAHRDDHTGLAPIGAYGPNRLGLFDTLGNLWESCRTESGDWVASGGACTSGRAAHAGPAALRTAPADETSPDLGFRPVRRVW